MVTDPSGTQRVWALLRLPRSRGGSLDSFAFLRGLIQLAPPAAALWGLLWLSGERIATDRVDVLVGLATAVPLWVCARAWRLPWWLTVAGASVPIAVVAVALIHGEAIGVARATKYAYGAILFLGFAAWARSPLRRLIVALAVPLLVALAFLNSVALWLGTASNPAVMMLGTLNWHNQFAMHMLYGFAIALVLAVAADGRWRAATSVMASFAGAGILLSGSRFGAILAVCVLLAAGAAAVAISRAQRALTPLLPIVGIVTGSVLLSALLRSPVFFPESRVNPNPLQSMAQRVAVEYSLNTRMDWWRVAFEQGRDNPVAGGGLLSFGPATACDGTRWKWHPHNEWMYAWAEGGLILLLPMTLLAAGAVFLIVSSARTALHPRQLLADPARWASTLAVVLGIGHLVTEYDLYYTMLVALLATTGGVAAAANCSDSKETNASRAVAWAIVPALVVMATLCVLLDPRAEVLPWLAAEARLCSG